ncbi:MAG: hypothetical protein J3Q66DRAFT_367420 [Benniella sp.]|nr:MAG: hypothetical protein J3Q66DRAFT_367420 [Benniella sp.]
MLLLFLISFLDPRREHLKVEIMQSATPHLHCRPDQVSGTLIEQIWSLVSAFYHLSVDMEPAFIEELAECLRNVLYYDPGFRSVLHRALSSLARNKGIAANTESGTMLEPKYMMSKQEAANYITS